MVTSNSTVSAPSAGMVAARRPMSSVNPSPVITCAIRLPHRVRPRGFRHNGRKEVRRVMRPTQWRPSTHLMVGVGVLAISCRRGGSGRAAHRQGPRRRPRAGSTTATGGYCQVEHRAGGRHRPDADRIRAGRNAGGGGGRPQPGQAGRPGHRRDDRQRTLAANSTTCRCSRPRRTKRSPAPPRCWRWTARPGSPPAWSPPTSPGPSCWSAAATRRSRRRRPGRTPGITARRGSAISPIRYAAAA